jgi:DNA-binding response OmpR family regulator
VPWNTLPSLAASLTVAGMTTRLQGKRILIVEDEFVAGELLRLCVEREAGVPIGPALTGQTAIDLLIHELPHAALLDVSLIDGSSVRVAGYLEARGVPYAILTGHSAESLPLELRKAPYIGKPVAPGLLMELLEQLLS